MADNRLSSQRMVCKGCNLCSPLNLLSEMNVFCLELTKFVNQPDLRFMMLDFFIESHQWHHFYPSGTAWTEGSNSDIPMPCFCCRRQVPWPFSDRPAQWWS